MTLSPEDFGSSFKTFLDQMAAQGPADEPVFVRHLKTHFEHDPTTLPIVAETFEKHEHPDIHLALEDYLAHDERSVNLLGVIGTQAFMGASLSDLATPAGKGPWGGTPLSEGPVQYVNVPLEGDRVLTCVQRGLYLIKDGPRRLAVLLGTGNDFHPWQQLKVEVMAPERGAAEQFLADLRVALRKKSIYRGRVLSLSPGQSHMQGLEVQFHQLPTIGRQDIILPEGLLDRIERQTVRFGRHSERLRAAGRHLKRGLLLHGPPGTGKTLTAMYLANAMRDRTVLLLTGREMGLLRQSCSMARLLQPSIVVLEDVDLVAEERTQQAGCATPVLFELLNEMDGLAEDADILFLLTTNRPELLEPALAARPGRIDQAIEVPLPDADCRRRLFDLYGRGLTLDVPDWQNFIARTEGASAAFIRELMRKAALFAIDEGPDGRVTARHLDEALRDLIVYGGHLTRSLLGFQSGERTTR
ncbi:MAG TPA: AAA family ATPase [Gemmataceae bacterium]|jgi:hypothetical protein